MAISKTTDTLENEKPLQPNLIICEGRDDQLFLIWLLRAFADLDDAALDKFQVMTTGGKNRLREKLQALTGQEGFADATNTVRSIAIIFDADNNPSAAKKRIRNSLKKAGFAVPSAPGEKYQDRDVQFSDITTGFMLFPKLDSKPCKGTLESLCLDILSIDSAPCLRCCVDAAMADVGMNFPRPNKNKLHAALALTDKHVGQTIGQAASSGAFNPASHHLAALKTFLIQMADNDD